MSAVLVRLLLFLLPFLLFALWIWVMKRTRFGREEIGARAARRITLAGLGLIAATVAGFVVFALTSEREHVGQEYFPPKMVDGEIRPGEFKESGGEDDGGDG